MDLDSANGSYIDLTELSARSHLDYTFKKDGVEVKVRIFVGTIITTAVNNLQGRRAIVSLKTPPEGEIELSSIIKDGSGLVVIIKGLVFDAGQLYHRLRQSIEKEWIPYFVCSDRPLS